MSTTKAREKTNPLSPALAALAGCLVDARRHAQPHSVGDLVADTDAAVRTVTDSVTRTSEPSPRLCSAAARLF